jgi:hypothetical protein
LQDKNIANITFQLGEAAPFYVQTGKRRSERQLKKYERKNKYVATSFKQKHQERSQAMVRCILEAAIPTSKE